MKKASKRRAPTAIYSSPNQLSIEGFESPFERHLNAENRWVKLAHLLPWDSLSKIYYKSFPKKDTGRPGLSPRVVLGAMIIKRMCNLDDRETVDQISENIYMQYFLGYPSFCDVAPFDASLFVEFRKRLGKEQLQQINALIVKLGQQKLEEAQKSKESNTDENGDNNNHSGGDESKHPQNPTSAYPESENLSVKQDSVTHKGSMIIGYRNHLEGQTAGKTFGTGIAESCKSRRTQSDRREVWSSKDWLRNESHFSSSSKNQRNLD